jgi:ATP-dependent DNA helicase RecQ
MRTASSVSAGRTGLVQPRSLGTLLEARALLRDRFGYPDFRPPQIRAVEAVLSGRDALVVLPTGGGKSLCYQVPALVRGGLSVVVSPLISLMKDQVEALERRGVAAAYINSTLAAGAVAERMARARDGSLALLYLSPERMEAGRTIEHLRAIGVALLAVDEAHCISEWGHDFRPSYRRIGHLRDQLGGPQTVALTATATPDVRQDIVRQLALREPEIVVGGFDRINLTYHVRSMMGEAEKDRAAIELLRQATAPSIVYTPTRKAVERIAALLVRARINATAYHAGLAHSLRQRAQDAFMEERTRVIVATSAFGMGIDKPDVRLVVHHAMPGSLEAYYQEAGRAGRDGKSSRCILLYDVADRSTHEYFIAGTHPERHAVERVWQLLRTSADPGGWVPLSADQLCRQVHGVSERVASAAMRLLVASHACALDAPSASRIWIRLLAAPIRIARELTGERDYDREVLRALWRATGGQLIAGTSVDLDGLPPGFGGTIGLVPVLERLASQQFVVWMRTGGGIRLADSLQRADSPPVDWVQLERRRRTELARLDAMQEYAQTHHCRRAYVLRYFGDPDARSHCGACDRCLEHTEHQAPSRRRSPRRVRPRPRS